MKQVFSVLALLLCLQLPAQQGEKRQGKADPSKPYQTVEAACGKCMLGLPGKDCDLAVRIQGKAYYVDGAHIDSLGDAHAKDGFCNSIRNAKVQGELINNRFAVQYIELLPAKKGSKKQE
jgi:hypothetical protein